jgi:hypothetical protein
LDQGRGVWESGVGLVGSVIEELLRFLGIDDGKLTVGTLLVGVWGSGGCSGNESWDWWHWWESNSESLPGDWVVELEEGGSIWKSGVGFIGSVIQELLGLLSIDDGKLTIGSLLVEVFFSAGSGGNESWDWWHWWESNSETLPGDWIIQLDVAGLNELLWADSSNVLSHGFSITVSYSELVALLSEFVVLLTSWTIHGNVGVHALTDSVSFGEFLAVAMVLLSELVGLLFSWTVDDNVGVHALTVLVSLSEFLSIKESDSDVFVVSWVVVVVLLKVNSLGRSKEKSQYGG